VIKKLADFAELKLLIDEYNPANSDWNFRRGVLLDILVRIWPQDASLAERRPFASDEPCDANQAWHELVEKDDRTSPEEYPDMCLITFDELKEFMTRSRSPAVSDATYCPFCDLEHELHEDAQGFHHVIKGERIDCVGRVKPHAFRSSLRTALCEDCSGTEDAPWHSQPEIVDHKVVLKECGWSDTVANAGFVKALLRNYNVTRKSAVTSTKSTG
jgi:hypothetical protein